MPITPLPTRGLYAITDRGLCAALTVPDAVARALRGGASMIQYRDKDASSEHRRREAAELVELCRSFDAPLLINDDVALAHAVGADGVHLGKEDCPLAAAREVLGTEAIIGVSCYNSLERAMAAQRGGASYVAFGRFYASSSKPDAVGATLELLRRSRSQLQVPIVAIGGITPKNGRELLTAGADFLAVISAVFATPDPQAAVERFVPLFVPDDLLLPKIQDPIQK